MPLQFRRGLAANLPNPSDAAVGEPLFTTDDGKLRIKKADGQYVVINDGSNSSSNIDLSGIDSGLLVKVNSTQDGFVAASASDLPSHNHAIANITALQDTLDNKSPLTHTHAAADITTGQIPSAVTFVTTGGSGFSNAVEARLLVELPTDGGVLDIAQESTLQSLVGRTITAGDGLTGGGDLSASRTLSVSFAGTGNATTVARSNHTHAATELTTAATSTGYLKWTYANGSGTWSVDPITVTAPASINGGDANADDPGN